MTEPVSGMRARRAVIGIGMALLVAMAGLPPAVAQDNPMASQPVDDEPEVAVPAPSSPAPAAGNSPSSAPAPDGGQRIAAYPAHPAPIPPVRPFSIDKAPGVATERPAPAAPTVSAFPTPPVAPSPAAPPAPPAAPPPTPAPVVAEPVAPAAEPRVASLPSTTHPATTEEIEAEEEKAPEPMLVEKQTDAVDIACLRPELLRLVRIAGEHFKGTPVITSGQRNRGRLGSYHRKCMAADFFVPGVERARLAKFLRTLPEAGGVGTYCHTKSVHIDIGEPRNWWQCGFRFRFAQR